jgi:hypothetical protein
MLKMKFTVREEFQHEGITYEPKNTHTKHGLSDEVVAMFHNAGWVAIDSHVDKTAVGSEAQIQPDDVSVVLN